MKGIPGSEERLISSTVIKSDRGRLLMRSMDTFGGGKVEITWLPYRTVHDPVGAGFTLSVHAFDLPAVIEFLRAAEMSLGTLAEASRFINDLSRQDPSVHPL